MPWNFTCLRINCRSSGYTLVELVCVAAILALAAVMIFPRYEAAIGSLALHQDAAVMVRELRLARQTAISSGAECAVVFRSAEAGSASESYRIRARGNARLVKLNRGVRVVGSSFGPDPANPEDIHRSACRFLPGGTPVQGGTVRLRNAQGKDLYVVVTPVTARVRVSRTDPGS